MTEGKHGVDRRSGRVLWARAGSLMGVADAGARPDNLTGGGLDKARADLAWNPKLKEGTRGGHGPGRSGGVHAQSCPAWGANEKGSRGFFADSFSLIGARCCVDEIAERHSPADNDGTKPLEGRACLVATDLSRASARAEPSRLAEKAQRRVLSGHDGKQPGRGRARAMLMHQAKHMTRVRMS